MSDRTQTIISSSLTHFRSIGSLSDKTCTNSEVLTAGGGGSGALAYDTFTIPATFVVTVSGTEPLVIIANNIVINGELDISGEAGGNAGPDDGDDTTGSAAGGGGGGGAMLLIAVTGFTIGVSGLLKSNGGRGGNAGGLAQASFSGAPLYSGSNPEVFYQPGDGSGGAGGPGASGSGGDGGAYSSNNTIHGGDGTGLGGADGGPPHSGVPPGAGGAGHKNVGGDGGNTYSAALLYPPPRGGAAYGDVSITNLIGGSGGGGGANDNDNEEGAGGGGSGGAIYVLASNITGDMSNKIEVNGGNGGLDDYQNTSTTYAAVFNNGGSGSDGFFLINTDTGFLGWIGSSDIKWSNLRTAFIGVCGSANVSGFNSTDIKIDKFIGVDILSPVDESDETQAAYTTPGTHSWTAPTGVTQVSVVCIGGGGGGMYYNNASSSFSYAMNGGGGGGLGYKNNYTVVPGQSYLVQVGAGGNSGPYSSGSTAGGDSYFINTNIVKGGGGNPGRYDQTITGGTSTGDGGGTGAGGNSFNSSSSGYGPAGGGGAGGYSGNGGTGYQNVTWAGSGIGGGGAGGHQSIVARVSGGGGGVSIFGEGSSGGSASAGGSSGNNGGSTGSANDGGNYGGGGGGASSIYYDVGGNGGGGAVRIIWGENRVFPNTNTSDVLYDILTVPTGAVSVDSFFKGNTFRDMTPQMTIKAAEVSDGGSSSDSTLSLTFKSTQPTNFASGDIILSGGSLNSSFNKLSATVYTATYTPPGDGAHTIDVAAGTYTNSQTPNITINNIASTQFNWTKVSGVAIGEYGNDSNTILFTGDQGSSTTPLEYTKDLSSADYAGTSVIGNTGHVFFRYETGTSWQQDPQLYEIDFDNSGTWVKVGQSASGTWGYSNWKTTERTTNSVYKHTEVTWNTVTAGTYPAGRWHRDTGGTPSSSTGVDKDYHIYHEGSSPAYDQDNYLRSPEFTFTSNTIKMRMFGYGANINTMYLGIYVTG